MNQNNTVEYWIERGAQSLSPDKLELWNKVVPIRLNDLYQGMELGSTLEIIDALKSGKTFDDAQKILYDQNHSGMSYGIMKSMLKAFYDDGDALVAHLR